MKPLENVWSGLVQRRLLPVAILLLAALAAIPLVLAKDPDPVPAPVAPSADNSQRADAATADPVVSLVADGERTQRRRVLGVRKNPFEPAKSPKVRAVPTPGAASALAGQTPTTDAGNGAGKGDTTIPTTTGGSPSPVTTPGVPVAPAPVQTEKKKPKHELYSLVVRFGPSEGGLAKMNLPRLKALPSAEDPVLVYLGPGKGGKTALFMVDASLEPQGDGTCEPSNVNCEIIALGEGETEFFDVLDDAGQVTAQYQLDLIEIKRSRTADASKAKKARAKASKAGRRVLRAHQSASGPLRYRYDTKSGTVRKIDKRAYKALLAKTARVAAGVAGGF